MAVVTVQVPRTEPAPTSSSARPKAARGKGCGRPSHGRWGAWGARRSPWRGRPGFSWGWDAPYWRSPARPSGTAAGRAWARTRRWRPTGPVQGYRRPTPSAPRYPGHRPQGRLPHPRSTAPCVADFGGGSCIPLSASPQAFSSGGAPHRRPGVPSSAAVRARDAGARPAPLAPAPPGSRHLDPATWLPFHRSRLLAPGPWPLAPGPWHTAYGWMTSRAGQPTHGSLAGRTESAPAAGGRCRASSHQRPVTRRSGRCPPGRWYAAGAGTPSRPR